MNVSISHDVILDREQAFLLFATFCGDAERTGHALNVSPVAVLRAADECGWHEKLRNIIALKKSGTPGDIERGISRALNFVLAHKYRLFLERVVSKLHAMSGEDIERYIFQGVDKNGLPVDKFATRGLADLASALEKMAAMTYCALGDTAPERAKRDESAGDGDSSGSIHSAIARAMAEVSADSSPRAKLLDAQLEAGQGALKEATKVVDIYSNDEH